MAQVLPQMKLMIDSSGAQKNIKSLNNELKNTSKDINNLNTSINGTASAIDNTAKSTASLKAQLKAMTLELQGLEPGSARFNELTIAAGKLKDQIADTNAVINATAGSATENLAKGLGGVAKIGIAGFQGVTSAMALFGVESGAIQQTLVQLQALAGLGDAIETLGGLGDILTNIKASAIAALSRLGLIVPIIEAQTVATTEASVAQYALNTAMLSNPIFLIIAGITALIATIAIYVASTDDAAEANERLNLQIENQNDLIDAQRAGREALNSVIKKSIQTQASQEKTIIDNLKAELDLLNKKKSLNISLNAEEKARLQELPKLIAISEKELKRLNLDDLKNSAADARKTLSEDLSKIGNSFNSIRAQIRATAEEDVFDDINYSSAIQQVDELEYSFKKVKEQFDEGKYSNEFYQKELGRLIEKSTKLKNSFASLNGELGSGEQEVWDKVIEKTKNLTKSLTDVAKSQADYTNSVRDIGNQNFSDITEEDTKALEKQAEQVEKTGEAISRNAKERERLELEKIKKIQEYNNNLTAYYNAIEADRQLNITDAQEKELQGLANHYEELIAIADAAGKDTVAITEEYQKKINAINKKYDLQKLNSKKQLESDIQLLNLETLQQEEINTASTEEEKESIREKYADQLTKLRIKQVETQRDIELTNTELTEEQRQKIIAESNLKIAQLNEKQIDSTKKSTEKAYVYFRELFIKVGESWEKDWAVILGRITDFTVNIGTQVTDLLGQLFSQLNQLANFSVQENARIRTEALDDELANRLITEEEYSRRVEELNDQREQKERAIKKKQFNQDKALRISNAIMLGAQSIVQALGSIPPPASYILAGINGALSAAQIGIIASQKFTAARGGIVPGTGPSTIDSVPATLAPGEAVINANSTSMFPTLLSEINKAGGGISLAPEPLSNLSSSSNNIFQGNQSVVKAVVVESELTGVQRRVSRMENSSTY